LLLAKENPEEQLDRREILVVLMDYLFADGPHPAAVIRRLYVLTIELAPELIAGISTLERRQLVEESKEATAYRTSMLVSRHRDKRVAAAAREATIRGVLAEAYRRLVSAPITGGADHCSLLAGFAKETADEFAWRQDTLSAVLSFIFMEGPAPRLTAQRIYSLAVVCRPDLILHMRLRQVAALFNETKAVWSWRIKRNYNKYLASRGVHSHQARFQRSEEACLKYARAQLGNNNRRGGHRAA
jgi:hypothetical protein